MLRLEPLLIGSIFPIHGEDRIVVTPEEVPALLPQALKAVEDRKFDTHHGIDPGWDRARDVGERARRADRAGRQHPHPAAGARATSSTRAGHSSRKVREAFMAMALDAHFTKADLMNAYINEIFLGQDGDRAIHGFGLASQFYFGKPLVGARPVGGGAAWWRSCAGPRTTIRAATPDRARARRDLVLKVMADQGHREGRGRGRRSAPPARVSRRAPGRGLLSRRTWISCAARCGATITRRTSPRPGCASTQASSRAPRTRASRRSSSELARLDRQKKHPKESLEGAVVVTAPQSGDVIAIVGGRDVGYDGFDRALDAHRSMGSLVKPFIYLTALESGRYNAATVVQDEPVDVKLAGRQALEAGELHAPGCTGRCRWCARCPSP